MVPVAIMMGAFGVVFYHVVISAYDVRQVKLNVRGKCSMTQVYMSLYDVVAKPRVDNKKNVIILV